MIFTSEKYDDDITTVTVNLSRATMDSAPQFRQYLVELIEKDCKNLIVDLRTCDFLDSSFLGALVFGLKKAKGIGGDLKILIAKQAPMGILSLTKMDQVFSVYKELDEAVLSYRF